MEDLINFWVNGVCTSTIVICGVLLNSFSIYIIWKKYDKQNIFYQLLARLLIIDICVLVTWMNLSLFVAFRLKNTFIIEMVPYFSYPSTHIAISASTFMTVAIAYERYLAVRHPLKYSEDMKIPKLFARRLRRYMFVVVLLSITFNLSYFLELEVIHDAVSSNSTTSYLCITSTLNLTNINEDHKSNHLLECNETVAEFNVRVGYTTFGKHPYYLKYYKIFVRLIVSGVVPFALLIYFNTTIYKAIKKNVNLRRRLTLSRPIISRLTSVQSLDIESTGNCSLATSPGSLVLTKGNTMTTKTEDNLSMVFVVIVTVFLCCNSMKFVLNFYDGFLGKIGATRGSRIAASISNLLIVLNSSMNMVIYCIMNAKFRGHFLETLSNMLPRIKTHKRIEIKCPEEVRRVFLSSKATSVSVV